MYLSDKKLVTPFPLTIEEVEKISSMIEDAKEKEKEKEKAEATAKSEEEKKIIEEKKIETGTYLIWSVEKSEFDFYVNPVIYVGSGKIVERLKAHIEDPTDSVVQAREEHPNLMASYVQIENKEEYQGLENFLAYVYQPTEGLRFPRVIPREIDLLPDLCPIGTYSSSDDSCIYPQRVATNYFPSDKNTGLNSVPEFSKGMKWDDYVLEYRAWAAKKYDDQFVGPQK